MIVKCHSCGETNEFQGTIGRRDLCSGCETELRCCLQCRLYEPFSPSQCREPTAEVPRDKNRANFCEFFAPGSPKGDGPSEAEKAKAAFDALFKRG